MAKATAKSARVKRPGRRTPKPLTRQQQLERDPWHYRRLEDPVFVALCNVLVRRSRVVYEISDWEPWVFARGQGAMTRNPDPICGSMSHLYNQTAPRTSKFAPGKGGGYIERFASSVLATLYDRREGYYGGDVALRPRYEEAAWSLAASERQGFKRWRTLRNGVVVWRLESPENRCRHFRAFKDTRDIARWGRCDGPGGQTGGHIGGDYSFVQGKDAPCFEFKAWLREVGKREITPPMSLGEAIVATLRHEYDRTVQCYSAEAQEQRFRETGRRSHLKPRRVKRTFEQVLRKAGWTKAVLAEFDRELTRQRRAFAHAQRITPKPPTEKRSKPCRTTPGATTGTRRATKRSAPTRAGTRRATPTARRARTSPKRSKVVPRGRTASTTPSPRTSARKR